jgi:hypothetical protein
VRRIVGGVVGCQVAAGITAIRWLNGKRIIAADMTLSARRHFACRRHLVRIGEGEAGGAMVESARRPSGDGMASRTSSGAGREACGNVVGDIATQGLGTLP